MSTHSLRRSEFQREGHVDTRSASNLFLNPITAHDINYQERWLIDNLILDGNLTILAGEPKSGKTCLATAIALAVATGTEFAGHPTTKKPVLWLACEESQDERRTILSHSPLAKPTTPLYTCYEPFQVDHGEELESVRDLMKLTNAGLLVIDPLYGAICGRSLSEAWTARKALMPLKRFCNLHNVAALVIHHTKGSASDSEVSRVGDHAQLEATAGAVMVLTSRQARQEVDGASARIVTLACKGRSISLNDKTHLISTGPLQYDLLRDQHQAPVLEKAPFCRDTIVKALEKRHMRTIEIAEETNMNPGTLRNAITRLRRDGIIEVKSVEDGTRVWGLVTPTPPL